MLEMTEEEKESLLESKRDLNFLLEDKMEEIKRVDIFYEDCENCSEEDKCPAKSEYEKGGQLLERMHDFLENEGIDSTLHPLTFESKNEIVELVSGNDCVLPVSACFDLDVPMFTTRNNYFYIEFEDGKRFLYLLHIDLLKGSSERRKDRMIYG